MVESLPLYHNGGIGGEEDENEEELSGDVDIKAGLSGDEKESMESHDELGSGISKSPHPTDIKSSKGVDVSNSW